METLESSGAIFHKGSAEIKSCTEKVQEDTHGLSYPESCSYCSNSGHISTGGVLMTDDLEKLKLIREAEDSANKEIEKARKEYEERLSEFSRGLENEVQSYRLKTEEDFRKNMESFKSELEKKSREIRERGRLKAEKLTLKISDKEIEKIVEKALLDYIKED
jgi:vacuolar-type H+-ATPase subunit H